MAYQFRFQAEDAARRARIENPVITRDGNGLWDYQHSKQVDTRRERCKCHDHREPFCPVHDPVFGEGAL